MSVLTDGTCLDFLAPASSTGLMRTAQSPRLAHCRGLLAFSIRLLAFPVPSRTCWLRTVVLRCERRLLLVVVLLLLHRER